MKVSTTSDPNAKSSDEVLACLNSDFPVNGAVSVICDDGTFIFVGIYSK